MKRQIAIIKTASLLCRNRVRPWQFGFPFIETEEFFATAVGSGDVDTYDLRLYDLR